IEAVGGAGEQAHAHGAAAKANRLDVSLHLLDGAPVVAVAHQHAQPGGADAGVEELVAAPRIGGEDRREAAPRTEHGAGGAARAPHAAPRGAGASRRSPAVSTAEPPRLWPWAPMRAGSISGRAASTRQAAST